MELHELCQSRSIASWVEDEEREQLRRYLRCVATFGGQASEAGIVDDGVRVRYERDVLGRYVARRSLDGEAYTLMTMGRRMRSFLASNIYHDIDMVNSHPTLLVQLFRQFDISPHACQMHTWRSGA